MSVAARADRIMGLETEHALGFVPAPGDPRRPAQDALFKALARALEVDVPGADARYYKGGRFLADGSLLHFELARLDEPGVGLLEWATAEARGPLAAAAIIRAQEERLRAALPVAEAALKDDGAGDGRIVVLKTNVDRAGNHHGCHESYDVRERPGGPVALAVAAVLHPLVLLVLLGAALVAGLPLLLLTLAALFVALTCQLLSAIPGLGALGKVAREGVPRALEWLADPTRGRGSGILAHGALAFMRGAGWLFSRTARRCLYAGHLPALWPFLVTRPVVCGAGVLWPDGRFELTPRARACRRDVSAFVHGPGRPLVDVKELLFRRPLAWRAPRKRLQHLTGDSSRAEPSLLLKLGTTALVLDAIEAGALDALAATIELPGGPVATFRRVAADPTLRAAVARDRVTNAGLTALDVQRRVLDAVAPFARARGVAPWEEEVLGRWRRTLDLLAASGPRGQIAREVDWAIKLRLLATALARALPDRSEARAWADLAAWGPVNERLEARAPDLELPPPGSTGDAVRARVRRALGAWSFRRALAALPDDRDWADLPAVRAAWLTLKTIDVRYHELSTDGGPFQRLLEAGLVERVLDPADVARASTSPPAGTRASLRGDLVRRFAAAAHPGWESVVIDGVEPDLDTPETAPEVTIDLSDPDRVALTTAEVQALDAAERAHAAKRAAKAAAEGEAKVEVEAGEGEAKVDAAEGEAKAEAAEGEAKAAADVREAVPAGLVDDAPLPEITIDVARSEAAPAGERAIDGARPEAASSSLAGAAVPTRDA